jgi:hypothetical protein
MVMEKRSRFSFENYRSAGKTAMRNILRSIGWRFGPLVDGSIGAADIAAKRRHTNPFIANSCCYRTVHRRHGAAGVPETTVRGKPLVK